MINKISTVSLIYGVIFFFCIHGAIAAPPAGQPGSPALAAKDTLNTSAGQNRIPPRLKTDSVPTPPLFTVKMTTDTATIDAPDVIHYTITVSNSGFKPLTHIRISAPLLGALSGPKGDVTHPGILDTNETWLYTGTYTVTQHIIDGNGVDQNNTIDGNGDINVTAEVQFKETILPRSATAPVQVVQHPSYSVSMRSNVQSIHMPGTIHYAIKVKNTGNITLTGIRISAPLLDTLPEPKGDKGTLKSLDVNETWTFTGNLAVTAGMIAGTDEIHQNIIDENGDISNTVTVDTAETETPQQATASVHVIRNPWSYSVSMKSNIPAVDAPGTITCTIDVKNTGMAPLSGMTISGSVLENLTGPAGDINRAGILDIGETWTYTGSYTVTQTNIDRNGIDNSHAKTAEKENAQKAEKGNGFIKNSVTVDFAETDPPQQAVASVEVIQNPLFTVTKKADIDRITDPETVTYTIEIKNTGNISLTGIQISDPAIEDLDGPETDIEMPGVLDVGEVWTYSGSFSATHDVLMGNGVDANNVIDRDGDIDNTVMVNFAETKLPQTAYAKVKTEPSIDGDIFEKNRHYLHGFLAATRLYTSNLYKTDRDPESCWATFITPGIWATVSVPNTDKRSVDIITANASPGGLAVNPFTPINKKPYQLYLLYSPQLEIYHDQNIRAYQDTNLGEGVIDNKDISQFTGQDSLNRLTHRLDAYVSYYSGNKLFLRAMDQYKISYDAFSERAYVTDDKYRSNMFNISGTLDATSKIRFRLDYSNFDLNYKDPMNSDADRMDNSIAAFLYLHMTSKTWAFLEYDFADINYDTSDKDSHEHRYFAGLRWQMTQKSSGQIKGGFGRKTDTSSPMIPDTDIKKSDINQNNWMAEIQIDHNFDSRTSLTLNAYRKYDEVLEHRYDYGDLQNFYADYILAHFVGFKLSREITSKIHLMLDTSYFYDDFKGTRANHRIRNDFEPDILLDNPNYENDRRDSEFAISPSINFDVFKWLSINGAYIYTDHDSNYPAHDYFDHTFFVRASLKL